jgi:hypothetical protein
MMVPRVGDKCLDEVDAGAKAMAMRKRWEREKARLSGLSLSVAPTGGAGNRLLGR